jgi:photosystem II stability/assembly factor-like uncharacterized protein
MKKSVFSLFIALAFAASLFAQQRPPEIYVGPDAPEWMHLMIQENPNVLQVNTAYQLWLETHGFEKNRYTQYYKRWIQWARPYTQADGSLHLPTAEEQLLHEKTAQLARGKTPNEAENLAPWSFVGPKQTYDTDGATVVTWQTNIYAFDVSLSNTSILYAGGETGGIWKTTDKGLNWTLTSANFTHGAFGAVKIHPTNPDIVYAATGGKIMKTTDGGNNWTAVYTLSNLWVNEFAISASDPNIVLAASDQGLLRSTNGGITWSNLFSNQCWTVKFKVADPTIVYAVRKNGSGSDFMRSTNSGANFNTSNTGWWTPGSGETVGGAIIAVCPTDPSRLYAYLCGNGANLYGYVGVFKSTDGGASWSNTHPAGAIGNSPTAYSIPNHTNLMSHNGTTGFDQGFYDMAIVVNPSNADQLIAGGTSWFRSNNGGQTWTALGAYVGGLAWSHPDIQCTVAVGSDLWIASDGGLNYSNNWASSIEARMNGISGSDMWGFDAGWNEDILVGGRYHNGNMAYYQAFPAGKFYRMGGAEAATGYVNPGPERKIYHSDIGGHRLLGGFTSGVSSFTVGLFPNESYAYYANSEMVWHPMCWNIIFLGKDNKIWKSIDGGLTFNSLYTFPGTASNTVFDIEIARSNPQVMYCSQWDGTDDKIWRSTDGGASWTACTALPLPNNNDRVKLAVAAENANVLWAAVTYGSNGKKVYKSTDGGATWINLTTTTLNNIRVSNIMAQYGTDGGVYLGTDVGVFYRNNTLNDWQSYSEGMPLSIETNRLKPFYKEGKIRNGAWGFGVWEAPLYENSSVIAQAMTDKFSSNCTRDTFYFDDYSVVQHSGASWNWTFSGSGNTVIGANTRTPKVVFGSTGAQTAIMALSTPSGVFSDTLLLQIGNGCDMDSLPGNQLTLDGDGDYAVAGQALNLNSNTVTLTAWIKPVGTQNDWAGIVFCRGGNTTAGLSLTNTNGLRYHWNDTGYGFNSNLTVPDNSWSHVALVVSPTNVKIYLNGVDATHTTSINTEEFNAPLHLGYDPNGGSRFFKGQIDEVCIFNKSLTQNEIREQMHLTRTHTLPTTNDQLRAYYQFNENDGLVMDRVGIRHANLGGNATRTQSSIPAGPGASARLSVSSGGTYTWPGTDLNMTFPGSGAYPNGELAVTRINLSPDVIPASPLSSAYWVVRNYGNNSFSTLSDITFGKIGYVPPSSSPSEYQLFKRSSNADGNTWGASIDVADTYTAGANGSVTFSSGNGIASFSQFVVAKPISAPVELTDFQAYAVDNAWVEILWSTVSEIGTKGFRVERSTDGVQFEPLKWTPAQGVSGAGRDYRSEDRAPRSGLNYYRLKIEDHDGTVAYSPIRAVWIPEPAPLASIWPNPVLKGGICQVQTGEKGLVRLRLYDTKGTILVQKRFEGNTSFELGSIPAGVYMYQVESERKIGYGQLLVR